MQFLPPEWHDRLPSTNTVLLDRVRTGASVASGFVLVAREQTAGRGRYNRRWVAEPGQNLTFSFLYTARASAEQLASLPLSVALGIADALSVYGIATQVKWPNDVLIDGGKICGMLLERSAMIHPEGAAIVVGIGLNVNMDATTAAMIDRLATSMRIETGREYAVEKVLDGVLRALAQRLDRWEAEGFAGMRAEWLARCALLGQRIRVGEGAQAKTGILSGFGDCGQMLLKTDDGMLHEIWAGDVAAI